MNAPFALNAGGARRLIRTLFCSLALGFGVCMLGACASGLLPKAPAAATLLSLDLGGSMVNPLPTGSTTPASRQAADLGESKTLVVEAIRADAGYDTRDMAYRRQTGQVEYFAHHQWVDTPARMLAPLLVRALESTGVFRAVVVAPSTAVGQLRLETTVVRLEQDFSQIPSRARLTLRAVLIDTASRQALATKTWDVRVDASQDNAIQGALAAGQATQSVMSQLATFCAEAATLPRGPTQ